MPAPERFRAKLDRAGELITLIHNELAAYHASDPFSFRTEQHDDPPRMEVWVESVEPPPLRLGVLMGEFIHNLRSTLDHLVWQLALTATDHPSERLQFPIYTEEPNDWRSIRGDRLKAVPDAAADAIRRLQPWHSPTPENTALAVVQALSNEDKHRVILETVSVPMQPKLADFDVEANFDVDEDMEIEAEWGAPLAPGMKALTATYTPIGPRPIVRLTGNLGVEVGFGTKGFRAGAMPGLAGEIVRHVRSFEQFFKT